MREACELNAIVWTDFENWPTPRRSVWASFVQVASFVEMIFFDARTSWGECSFGMFQATLSRPSSRELRPFLMESSLPAAAEVQSASRVQSPIPSRAQ